MKRLIGVSRYPSREAWKQRRGCLKRTISLRVDVFLALVHSKLGYNGFTAVEKRAPFGTSNWVYTNSEGCKNRRLFGFAVCLLWQPRLHSDLLFFVFFFYCILWTYYPWDLFCRALSLVLTERLRERSYHVHRGWWWWVSVTPKEATPRWHGRRDGEKREELCHENLRSLADEM